MKPRLSERVRNLEPSATLAVGRQARELQARGVKVLNLSVGEPDFPPPEAAKESVLGAVRENFSRYTESRGLPELRAAVARRAETDLGLKYRPEQVVVSCGSKHTLYNLFQVLLDPGDEVLIPVPYWTSYPEMVKLAGGVPVPVEAGGGFRVRPADLEARRTARTRALILNSPNNPSGEVYPAEELAGIADWLVRNDLLVISDDAYQHFLYDGRTFTSIASFPGLPERTLVVGAASKTYAMTGWRIGWFLGPEPIAEAVARLQDQSTSNPSSLSQRAALAALDGGQEPVFRMREAFQRRRDALMKGLAAVKSIRYPFPAGAFYLFFTHPSITDSVETAGRILAEKQVALVPGRAFGMEPYLRLSYAVADQVLEEAVRRLVDFFRAA